MKIRNPKPWRWNGTKTFTTLLGDRQITFGPLSIYAIPASSKNKALISGMRLHH
ncbi:hypothetical protein R3Q06_02860 [Rhodococcus erythropolis]|uniref:hypothetical protein n=1 Tax=Rhodococcus erythropolis TaxID=1833 RepID=UPI00294A1C16|nr:hypothetical protein [Rhodococcus erythropolis]MDV6272433.1 hypothetical protein [Rhodococcus erythropolis]